MNNSEIEQLPSWHEIEAKLGRGEKLTAVENVIYLGEPWGDTCEPFRASVLAVVNGSSAREEILALIHDNKRLYASLNEEGGAVVVIVDCESFFSNPGTPLQEFRFINEETNLPSGTKLYTRPAPNDEFSDADIAAIGADIHGNT